MARVVVVKMLLPVDSCLRHPSSQREKDEKHPEPDVADYPSVARGGKTKDKKGGTE